MLRFKIIFSQKVGEEIGDILFKSDHNIGPCVAPVNDVLPNAV
jgi:hypothetical protein